MASWSWSLKPGDKVTVLHEGARYELVIGKIRLDGPRQIAWQQGGKPPHLRSVILDVDETEPVPAGRELREGQE